MLRERLYTFSCRLGATLFSGFVLVTPLEPESRHARPDNQRLSMVTEADARLHSIRSQNCAVNTDRRIRKSLPA